MKQLHNLKRLGFTPMQTASASAFIAVSFALAACGGGGGGGGPLPPEAVVASVESDVPVLELSSTGGDTTPLSFKVMLDKAVASSVTVKVSTISTLKPDFASTTGSAKGGAACGGDVDYIEFTDKPVVFAAGATSGHLTVQVCNDAVFEPNETVDVSWTSVGAAGGTVHGTIINDDRGGLNGTGAIALLAGLPAFGRDVNKQTKDDGDGLLGFSFDTTRPDCVEDQVTGLTWETDWSPNGLGFTGFQARVDAANAGSGKCNMTGWRVPSSNELVSLMNFSIAAGGIVNADAMGSAAHQMTGEFWSSEQVANATDNAWVVAPDQGGAVSSIAKNITTPLLRLVNGTPRAAACNDAATRFTVVKDKNLAADGTIEDTKTGLMWKQCTEGFSGDQCNLTSTPAYDTANSSPTYVAGWLKNVKDNPSTLGASHKDWRVPTVKELASLVDRCIGTPPAINGTMFPGSKSQSYISATVNASDSSQFWYVDFKDGTVAVGAPANKYLRLVRAGQ